VEVMRVVESLWIEQSKMSFVSAASLQQFRRSLVAPREQVFDLLSMTI
jgi:hypothetical protein